MSTISAYPRGCQQSVHILADVTGFLRVMENLENLEDFLIFVEVGEKSGNLFLGSYDFRQPRWTI